MAAATPATNKWLLTKQAAVAPSGSRRNDGNSESERGGWGVGGWRSRDAAPMGGGGDSQHHHPRQKAWGRDGGKGWERGEGEVGGWVVAGVVVGVGAGAGGCGVEWAECSGPAVCSPFISALRVTYNLPGCQTSRSPALSHSSTLADPPSPHTHQHPIPPHHHHQHHLHPTQPLYSASLWWLYRRSAGSAASSPLL